MTLFKIKGLRTIFILYWFVTAYILAALIWWYIALEQQNTRMAVYKTEMLDKSAVDYQEKYRQINEEKGRKTAQYIGEGVTFLLLILAGAFFVYGSLNRQFTQNQQQQNFMMAITHELKTPIAITKLNLETLKKHNLEESQRKKLLDNTIQEANRLNALCNNMLLASQIESRGYKITRERIDLHELITGCVKDFQLRYPNRRINSDISNNMFVSADYLMIQMAVNNLLDNAIKYSGKDSPVTVTANPDADVINIRIIDQGKGIRNEDRKKIFTKYYRGELSTAMKAKGTGLGLFLTKKIIQQHLGDIRVTNNIPQGSIFEIRLSEDNE